MGWTFYAGSRAELVKDLTTEEPGRGKLLYSHLCERDPDHRGPVLWTAWAVVYEGKPLSIIVCHLLDRTRGDGLWGSKDMDESAGPFFYSCPPEWLDKVPDPCLGYSTEWRERARAIWAKSSGAGVAA